MIFLLIFANEKPSLLSIPVRVINFDCVIAHNINETLNVFVVEIKIRLRG
jgi:hypothetical protein